MLQVASGFAALAVGCDGGSDDDSGSGTDGTGSTSTSGGSTSGDGSSSSTGSDETTDGTTVDPGTSSGTTGGADTGSSSGEGSSSGSSSGGEANLCNEGSIVAVISMNHGHALEIPLADIEAGVETTYNTSGSNHCHEVVLTAEDFATLRAGGTVIKYSCNGGDHEYALSCVDGGAQPGDPAKACASEPQFGSC